MSRKIRRARASHADGGAAWISYSDMMAALLLLFVLVLCYCMFQYFSMLDTKTAELDDQAALLSAQQETLDSQQLALTAQQTALAEQETELETSRALLTQQQTQLDEQTAALALKQKNLDEATASLAAANAAIDLQRGQLDATAAQLTAKQMELDTASAQLAAKQGELDSASALLASQQTDLDSAAALLAAKQQELDAAALQLAGQQELLTAQQARIDDLVGVKTQIVRELTDALSKSRIKASVDPNTGDIMLESEVFFAYGKNEVTDAGKAFLDRFVPVYLGVLLQEEYADYLGEIIIEGHTDSSGTYSSNLRLSQQRALNVANYCLDMEKLTSAQKMKLRSILTATGKSYSNLIYEADGVTEDPDASRRVEFKFRLRDAEMIDEIRGILGS